MTKKHFIWGANQVIHDYKIFGGKFTELESYTILVKLFTEFKEEFDVDVFNSYIEKNIKK